MFIRYAILFSVLIAPSFLRAQEIEWHTDLDAAIAKAAQQQKPLMLHCTFKGCGPCKQLETYVFPKEEVVSAFKDNVIAVKVDVLNQKEIAKRYNVRQVPHDVFVSPTGYVLLSRKSPRDEAGYVNLVKDINKSYKTQEMLINGPVNLAEAKDELSQFGGQVRQQSLQVARDEADSTFGKSVDLVNHATGDVKDISKAIARSAADKYDTSDRFLSQPDYSNFNPSREPGNVKQTELPSANPDTTSFTNPVTSSNANPGTTSNTNPGAAQPQSKGDFVATRNSFVNQANSQIARNGNLMTQTVDTSAETVGAAAETVGNVQSTAPNQMQESFSSVVHNPFIRKQPAPQEKIPDSSEPTSQPKTVTPAEQTAASSEEKPVALDGYCTVTLQKKRQWKKGDEKWGCYHRGKLFLFAAEELRDEFMQDPDLYSPALAGFDPVVFAETGKLISGKREIGVFYPASEGKIFVFANAESKEKFQKTPELFSDKVRVATAECDQHSNLR